MLKTSNKFCNQAILVHFTWKTILCNKQSQSQYIYIYIYIYLILQQHVVNQLGSHVIERERDIYHREKPFSITNELDTVIPVIYMTKT